VSYDIFEFIRIDFGLSGFDETFKKAFSPDTEQGKCNLLNLLNDMLEGQIPHRIIDVYSQQLEQNESGSKESRTSIFDLHCRDEVGDFIEIEVQIRKKTNFLKRLAFYSGQMIVKQGIPGDEWNYDVKPTYVIAITKHRVFNDDRAIHRAGIVDYATNKPIVDSVNFTVVELPKVGRIIRENDAEAAKWMFALKYLNRIKRLPPALNEGKFKGLLLSAKVARFNKEELERYRYTMKMEWDDYAEWTALVEDHPEYMKNALKEAEQKAERRAVDKFRQSVEHAMLKNGVSAEVVKACFQSLNWYSR
jgi:predicted transposase/invertase (TIGR01784 family)